MDPLTPPQTAILTPPAGTEPVWAKPAVAIGSLVVFVAMVFFAYLTKDQTMMTLLGGAVVGMASQAGNYYLGSSSGSAAKTNLLAAAPPISPAPVAAPAAPVQPAPASVAA